MAWTEIQNYVISLAWWQIALLGTTGIAIVACVVVLMLNTASGYGESE